MRERELVELDPAELARRLTRALRRNLILIGGAALAGLLAGGGFLLSQEPFYRARTSIIIDPRIEESLTGAEQVPTALMADALYVDSEVEVLRSEAVLGGVVDALALGNEARVAKLDAAQQAGETVDPAALEPEALRREAIEDLAGRISVGREGTTYVVRIAVEHGRPDQAAAIANAVAEVYFARRGEERAAQTTEARAFLRDQVATMGAEVQEAEARADRFLLGNNLSDDEALSAIDQEIGVNDDAVIAARGRIRTAQAEIAAIEQALAGEGDAARVAQVQLVAALGGASDTRLSAVANELARLRDVRSASVGILEAEIASLLETGAGLKGELARLVDAQVELRRLRRTAAATQMQYELLLARLEEVESETGYFRVNARVIERATPPRTPANSSKLLVILAASAAGLLVGLGLAFGREQMDDSLRSSDDVTGTLGLAYFGPIPLFGRSELAAATASPLLAASGLRGRGHRDLAKLLYAAVAPYSFAAETLRRVMIEVRSGCPQKRPVVIAVASAVSNEGKSVLAANLAFFLAGQGRQVLLVDADLRNPDLSRRLLSLADGKTPDRAVASPEPGSTLFFAGLADGVTLLGVDAPRRLSDAERDLAGLERILRDAGGAIDVVVVDLPPLAFVSDSLGLAGLIDSVVLAVRWGSTRAGALKRVLAANKAIADKISGAVLTRVRPAALRRDEYLPVDDSYYRQPSVRPGASKA